MYMSSDKIQTYIKWCLLELGTNTSIDHRNYTLTKTAKVSPLAKAIEAHQGSFDLGIKELGDSISSKQELIDMVKTLHELHSSPDDNCDEIYELETELFENIIELTGLYEINGLHGDSVDKFKDQLLSLI